MKIGQLLEGVTIKKALNYRDAEVSCVCCDSRKVTPNALFVCLTGGTCDGHDYVSQAIENGAVAIVTNKEIATDQMQFVVEDTRSALSLIAANFYHNPAKSMKIVTVVGTNGKTSVTDILSEIFSFAGHNVGTVGTLGYKIGRRRFEGVLTTPDPLDLNAHLAEMRESGMEYVFIEASAHAIYYKKLFGIKANATVFTNVSQDHLDFFKTMEAYAQTKLSYFSPENTALAIVNSDDVYGRRIIAANKLPIITYGIDNPADVFAINVAEDGEGLSFTVNAFDRIEHLVTPLGGKFNVYNVMAAISVAMYFGIDLPVIAKALEKIPLVPGRFNVKYVMDRRVVLDFAHTPDGLENLLSDLKGQGGKIVTVFGCGGNRDRLKRPIMGSIAAKYSDYVIITNDNPRFEEEKAIAEEVRKGIPVDYPCEIILDREKAIRRAFDYADVGDTIVVAGKGHEEYIEIKGEKIPYSDSEVLQKLSR